MSECASSGQLTAVLASLESDDLVALVHDWQIWARDDQLPDEHPSVEPWRTWLILGGRGSGKTRSGSEWVRAQALGAPPLADASCGRIALVGETLHEARAVMVEGISGLLAIHPPDERPLFEPSKRQLTWPNGAVAQLFSAEDPEALRGPQFDAAWADELCKWPRARETFDMLQLGLRLGDRPRLVVTSSPRPVPLLMELMNDPLTLVTRSKTTDNIVNLAPSFVAAMKARFGQTALGAQELDGEVLWESDGALWRREVIEQHRLTVAPSLKRIVVAVDPPVTSSVNADRCGLVVAGRGEDDRAYVLADLSLQGREPLAWAQAVIQAFHGFQADRVVAEVNQGGELVEAILRQVDREVPFKAVRATRGKWVRAEPVAALYAQGRVSHVGRFADLEDEMCDLAADGRANGHSPDRVDALVWALTELMLSDAPPPRLRSL